MSASNAFIGFQKLSDSVSFYHPSAQYPRPEDRKIRTSLVVICSWVAANPKHVFKYAQFYQQKFPNTSILIIQSSAYDAAFRWTVRSHLSRIAPALDIVLDYMSKGLSGKNMLVHAFSNGGALTSSLLLAKLCKERKVAYEGALIFDSCPGEAGYRKTVKAFIISFSLRRLPALLYAVASVIAYTSLFIGLAIPNAMGIENVVSRSRRLLNDTAIIDREAPRLYLYSKADELVQWRDVQNHAAAARQLRFRVVRDLCWEHTEHCAHMVAEPDKYWDAVKMLL
ncbi:hypothetical protein BX600DRAFT_464353 [Xylariales sp. PMI_506]|nr:hypothetical protein BX600DRAFT_464353 [Xylariales sp. PMI_506]